MNQSSYKDLKTSRGLNYHYYYAASIVPRPTILFLHGFPSGSFSWKHQVAFFKRHGYGLIVPDMLGFGGTAKPTEVENYKSSLITKDLIDILNAEGIDKAIAIGHDL